MTGCHISNLTDSRKNTVNLYCTWECLKINILKGHKINGINKIYNGYNNKKQSYQISHALKENICRILLIRGKGIQNILMDSNKWKNKNKPERKMGKVMKENPNIQKPISLIKKNNKMKNNDLSFPNYQTGKNHSLTIQMLPRGWVTDLPKSDSGSLNW